MAVTGQSVPGGHCNWQYPKKNCECWVKIVYFDGNLYNYAEAKQSKTSLDYQLKSAPLTSMFIIVPSSVL